MACSVASCLFLERESGNSTCGRSTTLVVTVLTVPAMTSLCLRKRRRQGSIPTTQTVARWDGRFSFTATRRRRGRSLRICGGLTNPPPECPHSQSDFCFSAVFCTFAPEDHWHWHWHQALPLIVSISCAHRPTSREGIAAWVGRSL